MAPTYTHDFAKNVNNLISKNKWGLYNLVCGGQTSRLEVSKYLLELIGLNHIIKISEVSSDYFKEEYFADRPPSERLINYKLNIQNLNIMRDWKISLKEYIDKYYKNYLKGL